MQTANDNTPAADLLRGAAAIAAFMGFERRQIYHLAERGILPIFRAGDIICARKSTLLAWIEREEATAQKKVAA